MWFRAILCMEDDADDESMYMIGMMPCSCMEIMSPDPMPSVGDDESLVLGDEVVADKVFSLFFTVEFQKFFISLSVLPGKRAAI